jgi:spore cortex formation protein SpoVR/YcgB (stage V sporulation)
VRIVRKVAQYFYPQRQTKVMNEGWATFWHYTLLNTVCLRMVWSAPASCWNSWNPIPA